MSVVVDFQVNGQISIKNGRVELPGFDSAVTNFVLMEMKLYRIFACAKMCTKISIGRLICEYKYGDVCKKSS